MSQIKTFWIQHESIEKDFIENEILLNSGVICKIATNKITDNKLFILRVFENIDEKKFLKKEFQGVSIELLVYPEFKEITFILLDNELDEVFALFIENIYESINNLDNESMVINQTLDSIAKWKKLFDKIKSTLLTEEEQKGLVGELLFISESIENEVPKDTIIENWFGPDYYNKDFVINNKGFEIKTTTQDRPTIKISSEQQLDKQDLNILYLIQYNLEESKSNGFTLPELINKVSLEIADNYILKSKFDEKLVKIGYNHDDYSKYDKKYKLIEKNVYNVNDNFPKITKSTLPKGIFNSIYNIEILVLDEYKIETLNNYNLIYG
jgi:hypothetical protein